MTGSTLCGGVARSAAGTRMTMEGWPLAIGALPNTRLAATWGAGAAAGAAADLVVSGVGCEQLASNRHNGSTYLTTTGLLIPKRLIVSRTSSSNPAGLARSRERFRELRRDPLPTGARLAASSPFR